MVLKSELRIEIERKASEIDFSPGELAKIIDHTLLASDKTTDDFEKLCSEAKTYQFYSICVNPYWVSFCAKNLKSTDIKVTSVVGFPLGQTTSKIKATETEEAIENGAGEIDMVMNIAEFKNKDYDFVMQDIGAVVEAAQGNPIKVILETGYLNKEEIDLACKTVKKTKASFVKNSTGFGSLGATVAHVDLMRKAVGKNFGVKASGGISDFGKAMQMIAAGANRIGTSRGVEVINGYKRAKL